MTVAVPLEHPVKDRLLTPAQRAFWEENGYVIIPDAVPQENLERGYRCDLGVPEG